MVFLLEGALPTLSLFLEATPGGEEIRLVIIYFVRLSCSHDPCCLLVLLQCCVPFVRSSILLVHIDVSSRSLLVYYMIHSRLSVHSSFACFIFQLIALGAGFEVGTSRGEVSPRGTPSTISM